MAPLSRGSASIALCRRHSKNWVILCERRTLCQPIGAGGSAHGFAPHQGPSLVDFNVFTDRRFQFSDAAEHAAPDSLIGEFGKPSFHQIQPRTISWREVNVKAGPLEQPFADERS